jgi:hypothetical protein
LPRGLIYIIRCCRIGIADIEDGEETDTVEDLIDILIGGKDGHLLTGFRSQSLWRGIPQDLLYPEGHKQETVPKNEPLCGAVIDLQTFGDFLGFNPCGHILIKGGCFCYSTKSISYL